MKTLVLVNHWSPGIGNNKPPLGLCYLSAYLKKYLDFQDISIVNTGDNTFEKIKQLQPEIVGFMAYTAGYYDVHKLINKVKRELGSIILVGGPHITCLPDELPEGADIGVVGEGEQTLLEIMKIYLEQRELPHEKLTLINGLVFRQNGKLQKTAPRALIKPIDNIPIPDRDLLDMEYFLKPSQVLMNSEFVRGTTMLSSRGCPYNCIYCHVAAKWGKPRLHSAKRVVDEIELLINRYQVKAITMSDDLFVSSPKRIQDIVDDMEKRNILGKVRFFVDLRANLVNDKLIQLVKKMGVVKVALGLESGSEKILHYLKGDNVTVEQNKLAVQIANKYDIGCHCCFMIGAPPETKQDIEQTQNLISNILDMSTRNSCQVTVTTPLPGTKLWDYAMEKGYIKENIDWRQFSLSPFISKRKDFYVNEHIEFEEFLKIAKQTHDLTYSRRLNTILANFNWRYIKRIFADPKLAFKIFKDYLKFH